MLIVLVSVLQNGPRLEFSMFIPDFVLDNSSVKSEINMGTSSPYMGYNSIHTGVTSNSLIRPEIFSVIFMFRTISVEQNMETAREIPCCINYKYEAI